ncbi:MAG TPA: VWA domain-containing protein [Thermoanaerobaculia bacterium]
MRAFSIVILLLAVPLFAQRYDDAITVNVVDVPVYVERFGKPVTGLTRDDFELFVGGKPHPIEYFDVLDEQQAEQQREAAGAPADLARRRLVVLLFHVEAPSHSLQRAQKAAVKYVAAAAATDTLAVATVSAPGVLFIVPFTNDRVAVQRAIATLRPSAARDPFRVATLGVERDIWEEDHPAFQPPAIAGWHVDAAIDMDSVRNDYDNRSLIENLSDLAGRLAPLEGLKEVVLFSEGNGDPAAAYTWAGTQHATIRMHQHYRAAGVILNAVDIGTPRAPGGDALVSGLWAAADGMPDFLTSSFLWSLALDTGGIATFSLPELEKRRRAGYLIGFRAPPGRRSSSIRVHVKNVPLLTDVRYRKAYTLGHETKDEGLFLADALLNDIPQNGVTLDLAVNGTWVAASIPGVELLSYASGQHRLHLDVYFYVFDREQRPVAWNRMQIAVDLEKGREFLSAHPYAMRQEFVLEPGRYVAKALVRIKGTDRVGFERTEFEVKQ